MISILMSYYNRKDLLINTLKSIELSEIKDYEIIIVDDNSNDEHRIEDLMILYKNVKIIRINKEDKWWVNPCINFNNAFRHSNGDIIIIQNPECKHIGDILKESENITDNEYFSFACYSLDKDNTYNTSEFKIVDKSATFDGELSWYNHSNYRPTGYHFCSMITRKNYEKLGGFDEKYAEGIAYDDDEFFYRVKQLGLQIKIIDYPFVAHQWHQSVDYTHLNYVELINKNKDLFVNYTQRNGL